MLSVSELFIKKLKLSRNLYVAIFSFVSVIFFNCLSKFSLKKRSDCSLFLSKSFNAKRMFLEYSIDS